MAVLKIACPKCGQKVSGDESFYGSSVSCPICSAKIAFPEKPDGGDQPAKDALSALPTAGEGTDPPAQPQAQVPPPPGHGGSPSSHQNLPTGASALPQGGPLPAGGPLPSGGPLPGGVPGAAPSPAQSLYGVPQGASATPDPPVPAATTPAIQPTDRAEKQDDKPGPLPLITLISGIVSMMTFWCFGAILFGPAAIITGHIALIRMNANESRAGKGKVLTGLILGYFSLVLMLIASVLWVKVIIPRMTEIQAESALLGPELLTVLELAI